MTSKVFFYVPNSVNDPGYNWWTVIVNFIEDGGYVRPWREIRVGREEGKGFHGVGSSVNRGSETQMCGCGQEMAQL